MGEREIAGRYVLEEPIGHGGMGRVWRARDRTLKRKVALKEVWLPAGTDADEAADRYWRAELEAQTAGRINHPSIVTVHDVVWDDGRPWIVMEYVPSQSLHDLVDAQGPLAALRAARIGRQLLDALAAAHAEGVLHRDVKPRNVLIAPGRSGDSRPLAERTDERAVLTDFGIALFEGGTRVTQANQMFQTAGFTAPERYAGDNATSASDLWSLGATLYAAVEGHGPFERGSDTATMYAVVHESPPPAVSAGPLLAHLITALLQREPSARPSAAAAASMLAENLALIAGEAGRLWLPAPRSLAATPTETAFAAGSAAPTGPQDARRAGGPQPVLPAPTQPSDPVRPPDPVRPRVLAPPGSPALPDQATADHRQSADDLLLKLAWETGGVPSARRVRNRNFVRRVRTIAPAAVAIAVLAAAGIVIYEFAQPGPSPGRSLSRSAQAPNSTVPAATGSSGSLPPVSRTAAVARAIDQISHSVPAGYQPQVLRAAVAGSTAGFSLDVPRNWVLNSMGQQSYQYTPKGPDDGVIFVEIDLTKDKKTSMLAEAMLLASQHQATYPDGYQRIAGSPEQPEKPYTQPEPIRRTAGALWQFDYVSNGRTMRMDVLLFTLDQQSYTIYMTAPAGRHDSDWNTRTLPIVEKILHTFEPVPA